MDMTEAAQVARRLLNERRALEYITDILETADSAQRELSSINKEIASLTKKRDGLQATISAIESDIARLKDAREAAERDTEARIQQLNAELEKARQQHIQELNEMKKQAADVRQALEHEHSAFMHRIERETADAERKLTSVNHELEAVRRKMSGLLANG